MSYTSQPNPWTGVPLVGTLIDSIQNFLTTINPSGALPTWFMYGAGSPVGVLTPASGDPAVYFDTTSGAWYVAVGATDSDWVLVGGFGDITVSGVQSNQNFVRMVSPGSGNAAITDSLAAAGTGNRLNWDANGTDGQQRMRLVLGSAAQYEWAWNADGTRSGPYEMQGSGSPVGVVTPAATGATYQDVASGALYLAVGATSADWVIVGGSYGGGDPLTVGVEANLSQVFITGPDTGNVVISNPTAASGSGNGIYYNATGTDGQQYVNVILGSSGQYEWQFSADGSTLLPGSVATAPPASSAPTLALGTAYQNTLGYDILLTVTLAITINASGSVLLGVGSTNTPTQQTILGGVTTLGLMTVPIYLPNQYYALLSLSGLTASIVGQIAMAI